MQTTRQEDSMTAIAAITKIVETDVLGVKAYHYECSCGDTSQRYDRETTAVRYAKTHAAIHA